MAAAHRVHIITPIISSGFRDATALYQALGDRCDLSLALLDKGPASVESAVDEVLAAPGVVDAAIRAEQDGVDALVIDCMLDPGLDAAREAVSIPVIGAGEAGLAAAARHGRFSIVTVLERQTPMFRALACRHGLADRLVSIRGIGLPVLALEADRADSLARTVAACEAALYTDGASGIVFGCTGMLGYADTVTATLGLAAHQIIDPLPHALGVALQAAAGQNSSPPPPERKRVTGFEHWTALHAFMAPEAAG